MSTFTAGSNKLLPTTLYPMFQCNPTMRKPYLLLAAVSLAQPLLAQDEDLLRRLILTDGVDIAGEFFIAVIAGVIIAFATQYLLTALSVAIGISAVPNLKHTYAEAKARDTRRGTAADERDWNDFDHEADDTPTGVKISAAAGAWNLVTTAVALFTGAAFGLTLVPALLLAPQIAITVALVIWGVFFITLFWLESRFASTIVGTLISAATSGLKTAAASVAGVATGVGGGIAGLVTPSQSKQIANVAESTIDELDARFGDRFDSDRIVEAIEEFTQETTKTVEQTADELGSNVPSYEQLKADIREIALDSAEAGKPPKSNPAKWTAIQSVIQSAVDGGDGDDSEAGKQRSAQLKQLMQELKAEYEESGDIQAAAKTVAEDHADDEEVEKLIGKIRDSLKSLGGGANGKGGNDGVKLDVATIQREIEGVLGEGGSVDKAKVQERLRALDREQVVKLVAGNTSLSEEQLEGYADQAEQALTLVKDKLGVAEGDGSADGADLERVRTRAEGVIAKSSSIPLAGRRSRSSALADLAAQAPVVAVEVDEHLVAVDLDASGFVAEGIFGSDVGLLEIGQVGVDDQLDLVRHLVLEQSLH